jgi:hypothetical protein
VLPDVVGAAVTLEATELLACGGALAVVCVFLKNCKSETRGHPFKLAHLHIVLDQWISGPAVNGNENRAGGGCCLTLEANVPVSKALRSVKFAC